MVFVFFFFKVLTRTKEMAQWVKCLHLDHEDLISIPQNLRFKESQVCQHTPAILALGSRDQRISSLSYVLQVQ